MKGSIWRYRRVAPLLAALALAGCASPTPTTPTTPTTPPSSEPSLYQRLGGGVAIAAVIDAMVVNVAADPRINFYFAGTDIAEFKTQLAAQLCDASGGPCEYRGRRMRAAHAGMNIKNSEFDALVEALVKALNQHDVGRREQDDLLALLGPMRSQIVIP